MCVRRIKCYHPHNIVHESHRFFLPMLNPFEPLFPLRGHHRGTQIFRQNRNQSRRFFRSDTVSSPFARPLAHDKSHINQLFQRPASGLQAFPAPCVQHPPAHPLRLPFPSPPAAYLLKAFVKGVRYYFSYYLRRFSLASA